MAERCAPSNGPRVSSTLSVCVTLRLAATGPPGTVGLTLLGGLLRPEMIGAGSGGSSSSSIRSVWLPAALRRIPGAGAVSACCANGIQGAAPGGPPAGIAPDPGSTNDGFSSAFTLGGTKGSPTARKTLSLEISMVVALTGRAAGAGLESL